MKTIQTVCGSLPVEQLGNTLMHEHMLMLDVVMRFAFPDWIDEKKFMEIAVPQLKAVKAAGLDTIIDATPINLGRDVRLIHALAEQSGIQILVSTGMYHFEGAWFSMPEAHWLADLFVREIEEGIQGTKIRAAVIKCATDEQGLTPSNRRMLEASAIASIQTGAPIFTHTVSMDIPSRNGLEQQAFLAEQGVELSNVVIGHAGDSNDVEYLVKLMENGSYLGLDRFGLEQFNTMENRINTLVRLVELGWAHRLLLSHDSSLYTDAWRPWHSNPYHPQGVNHCLRSVPEIVLPELRRRGVKEADIQKMMKDNLIELFV